MWCQLCIRYTVLVRHGFVNRIVCKEPDQRKLDLMILCPSFTIQICQKDQHDCWKKFTFPVFIQQPAKMGRCLKSWSIKQWSKLALHLISAFVLTNFFFGAGRGVFQSPISFCQIRGQLRWESTKHKMVKSGQNSCERFSRAHRGDWAQNFDNFIV